MNAKDNAVVSIPVRVSKPLAERIERLARSHDREIHQECAAILRVVVPSLEEPR